jgi:mannose-1-phosphate guanylyltransferase
MKIIVLAGGRGTRLWPMGSEGLCPRLCQKELHTMSELQPMTVVQCPLGLSETDGQLGGCDGNGE